MCKKKKNVDIILPKRALTNVDINKYVKKLKIPYFRGVYMLDTLPVRPLSRESAIVNLDVSRGPGTHWVAYKKRGNKVLYFDSFGDLRPPLDLMRYLNQAEIQYNTKRYQSFDSINCGHLCLRFLHNKNGI